MNLVTLENINKSYSEKTLLKDVFLGINDGDKIGLIGINGAGKSTFLKIIAGKEDFFDGTRTQGKNIRIEYLSQDVEFKNDTTVIEQIFKGDTKEMKLLMEYEDILSKIESGDLSLNDRFIKLQSEIDTLNLWSLENEAKSILNKLGINNYSEKMVNLSGGQRKRVFLASALITPCELLILDEPTNHLDSNSIEWLEEYLNGRKGSLVMITHDRYFLDRVSNKIIELDRGNLYSYEGNYTKYLEKKVERIEIEKNQEAKRQALIRNELKWVKRGAKARTTKQKARLDRFQELVNKEYVENNTDIKINYVGSRLGKKIIEIENLNKSFDNKVIVNNFNYIFTKEDRIGIVGDNGAGKTTFLKMLEGAIKQDSGEINIGETVKIGVFSQDGKELDKNQRVIDFVREGGEYIPTDDGSKISASTLCERFLFDGSMQYSPIEKLSGGEKRRLQLLRVLMESPNFLIFDEPTNDLDIETLKILEDFLDDYAGVVVVVSHDRYFLDRVCNKIFAFEGNGNVTIYHGNHSDYLIRKEIKNNTGNNTLINEPKVKKEKPKRENQNRQLKFSFKEQKEFKEIDKIVSDLEEKLENIQEEIELNSTNYSKLEELISEKEETELLLLEKYERQEYLNELDKKIKESKKFNN
ncbi:MAG: ABC-F family ATP-binding cassette domain-containing protein [Clostridium baratii]|uniref:ABC-F family ATP-binding cassette domain-containing protein n=1 Tax=Clostridium baratii TaxID=1561 RepID=UPI002432BF8E|nr:ABC-F family ATP-binding cassette domain-containing protein [Clostridium baratii]MBS6006805.1 ABC-F family ATP-binding cassette domain-containing protein [Clostridium baratii]MDU4910435.1 ABC-F family ATP-binding cassette domain-containing protein [Clostridium baratii]